MRKKENKRTALKTALKLTALAVLSAAIMMVTAFGSTSAAQDVTLGDVNGDGKVALNDAQLALKAALNLTALTDTQKEAADVNGEKGVTLADAQLILRYALNLINIFPADPTHVHSWVQVNDGEVYGEMHKMSYMRNADGTHIDLTELYHEYLASGAWKGRKRTPEEIETIKKTWEENAQVYINLGMEPPVLNPINLTEDVDEEQAKTYSYFALRASEIVKTLNIHPDDVKKLEYRAQFGNNHDGSFWRDITQNFFTDFFDMQNMHLECACGATKDCGAVKISEGELGSNKVTVK